MEKSKTQALPGGLEVITIGELMGRNEHTDVEALLDSFASDREIAQAILGVGEAVDYPELQRLLIEVGYCVDREYINSQIKRANAGHEDTVLPKDGRWTVFFLRNHDGTKEKNYRDETVSIVDVYLDSIDKRWYSLDSGFDEGGMWNPCDRIVFRPEQSCDV